MDKNETKICQNCKKSFTIKSDDFAFYARIDVPPPTFCPMCREQRRVAFRNERVLYRRTCDKCKKSTVTMYAPEAPYVIYCRECWWGDAWDPMNYGKEYDFSKPFFAQFNELMRVVPRVALLQYHTNPNSDYANYVLDAKNTYLAYSVLYSENVYYSRLIDKCKECFDSLNMKESEMVYENVDGARNYRSWFLVRSRDCIDSVFLFDCVNCQHCFMSANLRNKQYVFRNQQLTKESYDAALEKEKLGSSRATQALRKEFLDVIKKALHKYANVIKSINCTGDNIDNSKNVQESFDAYGCENVRWSARVVKAKDIYDCYGTAESELVYESVTTGFGTYNSKGITFGEDMPESAYSDNCQSSSHLFGCEGLRKKKYCILNRQYTKEEYEGLLQKVCEQMAQTPYIDKKGRAYRYGEFFPIELSPFAYNETLAQELHPLTREEAITKGYAWREPNASAGVATIAAKDLPDDISTAEEKIVNEIIACSACQKPYRVVKPEFDFLKQHKLALPQKCLECRYQDRLALRKPLKLWHRQCMRNGCSNTFETSYPPERLKSFSRAGAPDRPEVVYCEQCYQAEVV